MRRSLLTMFITLLSLIGVSAIVSAQETIQCADTLSSRLLPDMIARVTPGDANRVRNAPSTDGDSIGSIPGEGEFYVLAGPICAEGFAWWLVEYDGLIGWTVEGGNDYWLEPVSTEFVVPPRELDEEVITPFAFNGVTFDLSNRIADSAEAENITDVPPDSGAFSMDVAPAHTRIDFEGRNNLYFPYLAVYPADEYAAYRNYDLENLQTTLAEQPENPDYVGPGVNAGIHFAVQPDYVDFVNGTGLRAIVHWSQSNNLVTDGGLWYVYAGLTDDGQHLVHMVMPLESPRLATLYTVIGDNWDYTALSGNTYANYLDVAEDVIADHDPDEFSPSLATLDTLITSLDLTAYNRTTMQDADGNLCAPLRSRLQVDEFARQALAETSLRVRDMPGGTATGNNLLPGESARILAGPECVDDVAWWQIESAEGWSGWVAEAGDQAYYLNLITRTPTPTATYTPAPPTNTPTPRPTSTFSPTATPSVSECVITPIFRSVLRTEPDVDALRLTATIPNDRSYYAIAQYQRPGEEFPWWQLGSRVEAGWGLNNTVGRWIRADFVTEEGPCDTLPVYEYDE